MYRAVAGGERGTAGAKASSYGRALRAMRAWRGMSGACLAKLSGYSQRSISVWERGVHHPRIQIRKDLCEALRFPLDVMENLAKGESALERAALNLSDFNEPGKLYDRFELAAAANVHPRIVQNYVNDGLLKPIKDGRFRWYTAADIETAKRLRATRVERQVAKYKETMRRKKDALHHRAEAERRVSRRDPVRTERVGAVRPSDEEAVLGC